VRKRTVAIGGLKASVVAGLVLSASLLWCVVAGAQEQRVALVIGNGHYQHNASLLNPANDAADMAAALKEDGFSVTLLTDASRKAMEQAVRAFGNSLKNPDAIGMFYYSGHGAQAERENYLIPVDADIQDADELAYSAVDAESILAKMRSAGNKINIVVLDACRDNPFPGSSRSGEKGLAVVKVKVPESVIVYATDPGSTASDGKGRNSPFTKAFLENMDAPGQDIAQMMKRVTRRVQTETDGKQTPWVSTNLTRDFAFRSASGSTAVSSLQPAATPTMAVTPSFGSLVVTTVTEGTLYLDGKAIGDVPAGANVKLDSVEAGDRSLELHYADGRVEQQSAMVEAGSAASVSFNYGKAPPNQDRRAGQTKDFFELVRNETPQNVQAAIDKGADVKARDKQYGGTALMYAAQYNPNPDVITVLLKAGADLRAQNTLFGVSPLMYAVRANRNPEVIATLLKAGADVKALDRYGETALMYAAQYNPNLEVIAMLLKAGADLRAQNNTIGMTALMYAVLYNPNPDVVTALLKAGADGKQKDRAGNTAFDYVQNAGRLKGTAAYRQLQEASQ
jgi:uncharacterized caspase-like protein/ankyrin repeat protein